MRAIAFREHGPARVLSEVRMPVPEISAREVLIRVKAASVNHLDIFVRRGLPGLHVEFPHIPGADAAGIVEQVGDDTVGLEPGTRVTVNPGINCGHCPACASGHGSQCPQYRIIGEHLRGSYAEYLKVPYYNAIPIPDAMGFEEAAAIPLVFLTAWSMMITKGRLRPGEDVLILGAGAGVGTAAIQIAKMVGCRVFASASSAGKLEKARQLGADILINHLEQDVDAAVRELTHRRGVDVVIDYIGGDSWVRSLRSARQGGRILTCGATAGAKPSTDLRHIFYRQLQIIGSTMGSPSDFDQVMRCAFRGQLKGVIDRVLPLSETGKAHELLENREVFGKLVLVP
jgi:NADPH:quinone reductase-like Zn-dependent oxidoreductase